MSETYEIPEYMLRWGEEEKKLIKRIGDQIGYGRMMQLAQECWREVLIPQGLEGGEFQSGPCVGMTEPCGCKGGCDWCAGALWLTKHVKTIKDEMENVE